ncbi:UNVERIFIED_CONTAM: putative mitochondrial protein [Sesamum latifolium]|uniref:Mitochondrial protein n=1 Tax=Sesamum latifolium TaxID=2727402 RepID=A0AAW2X484_9LAMI
MARLDWACANSDWSARFSNATVEVLPILASDHAPLILNMTPQLQSDFVKNRSKAWRFEAMWLRADECEKVISDCWKDASTSTILDCVTSGFDECRIGLARWSKRSFGHLNRKAKELEERIIFLQSRHSTENVHGELKKYRAEIERCLAEEEIMWKQRGKADWLKEGDRNTGFFHEKASHRHRLNRIERLKNSDDLWCHEKVEIQNIIVSYFNELFTSANPSPLIIDEVVNTVERKVSEEMNRSLKEPYTEKEIVEAISQMSPLKSPGPDGRLISDNILVAYETNQFLKTKTGGKKGYAAIKLHMSKAYDRVEWVFLESILLRLGFECYFVRLLLMLVSTVNYSFVLNGETFGLVRPSRGIRQGDPLSPYLFLFCAEALSGMFKAAESSGLIQGVRVARGAPRISHLLFADDTLVFCEATAASFHGIRMILDRYAQASGQIINLENQVWYLVEM